MTKMKLCPIEAGYNPCRSGIKELRETDCIMSVYKTMTKDCPTVEIVSLRDIHGMDLSTREEGIRDHIEDYLKLNNYMIVRKDG